MSRLDTQRAPVRTHIRQSARWSIRGYDVLPHATWGDSTVVSAVKDQAAPGSIYPAEPTVVAQDATNAGRLAGLGYVAVPTSNWTTGQSILVGSFRFNWNGTAWAAGIHA